MLQFTQQNSLIADYFYTAPWQMAMCVHVRASLWDGTGKLGLLDRCLTVDM